MEGLTHIDETPNLEPARPVPEAYKNLIEEAVFHSSGAPYAESFNYLLKDFAYLSDINDEAELRSQLTELGIQVADKMKGSIVIDLACGHSDEPSTLANVCGAKEYIGVDIDKDRLKREGEEATTNLDIYDKTGKYQLMNRMGTRIVPNHEHPVPSSWYADDVLGFVSKLERPKERAVFVLSGFEPYADTSIDKLYLEKLADEIHRLTKEGDMIIVSFCVSKVFFEKLNNAGFEEIGLYGSATGGYVYIKKDAKEVEERARSFGGKVEKILS